MEVINILTREQLRHFARAHGLREEWDEPDEQEVNAIPAVGHSFGNEIASPGDFVVRYAQRRDGGGIYDEVYSAIPVNGVAEHGVFLFHRGEPVAFVNLALLLAMACGFEGFA